ncbi:MAG: hypothetical protein SGARI_007708 [Bacillariaceae sp.]
MASEEERAKIMAEYLAGNAKGDSVDEDEFEDYDDDDDEKPAIVAILKGRLKINDESLLTAATPAENQRFKLKSTQQVSAKFLTKPKGQVTLNGFFTTGPEETKIKERQVVLDCQVNRKDPTTFSIKGHGTNDYGDFVISGLYKPTDQHWFQATKTYLKNDVDDDEISKEDDHGASEEEMDDLHNDAELSVEELRKKYYNDKNAAQDDKPPPAKKPKVAPAVDEEDDDDDEECGF